MTPRSLAMAIVRSCMQLFDIVRAPSWREPLTRLEGIDVVILDKVGAEQIARILGDKSFHVVATRGEYVHKDLLLFLRTALNIFVVGSPLKAYALSVIKTLRPKLVITLIDNSGIYQSLIGKYSGARFLAIQNGIRNLARDNPGGVPSIRHEHFACFGESVADQYNGHHAKVLRYHPLGSLRQALFVDEGTLQGRPAVVDLCLVSEVEESLEVHYPDVASAVMWVSVFFAEFCKANKCSYCIVSRYDETIEPDRFEYEKRYFQKIWDQESINLISNRREEFTSYAALSRSRVGVSFASTLLLERFGEGGRVLFSNAASASYSQPLKGIWYLEDPTCEEFSDRLSRLLAMSDQEYLEHTNAAASYMMNRPPKYPRLDAWKQLVSTLCDDSATK